MPQSPSEATSQRWLSSFGVCDLGWHRPGRTRPQKRWHGSPEARAPTGPTSHHGSPRRRRCGCKRAPAPYSQPRRCQPATLDSTPVSQPSQHALLLRGSIAKALLDDVPVIAGACFPADVLETAVLMLAPLPLSTHPQAAPITRETLPRSTSRAKPLRDAVPIKKAHLLHRFQQACVLCRPKDSSARLHCMVEMDLAAGSAQVHTTMRKPAAHCGRHLAGYAHPI
mmetsp:Transcript_43230/g.100181  ORF Transcript_43230/g.100181 Transcript_43230/m.100181 type:complete len:225 (-) Transcript_43230:366-1040(-)